MPSWLSRWGRILLPLKKEPLHVIVPGTSCSTWYPCNVSLAFHLLHSTQSPLSACFFSSDCSYAYTASCKKNNIVRRNKYSRNLNNLVVTYLRYGLDNQGVVVRLPVGEIFSCFTKWPNRLWSPPNQPSPVPRVSRGVSVVVKGQGREADHSTPIKFRG
jgi:hypothetical protein